MSIYYDVTHSNTWLKEKEKGPELCIVEDKKSGNNNITKEAFFKLRLSDLKTGKLYRWKEVGRHTYETTNIGDTIKYLP